MMETIYSSISCLISISIGIILLHSLFKIEFNIKPHYLFLILAHLLVSVFIKDNSISLTINVIFEIFFLFLIINNRKYSFLILIMIVLSLDAFVQNIVEIRINYSNNSIFTLEKILIRLFNLLAFSTLGFFIKKRTFYFLENKKNWLIIYINLFFAIISGLLPMVLIRLFLENDRIRQIITFTSIAIILLNFVITFIYIQLSNNNLYYQTELELKEALLKLQEENVNQIVQNYQHLKVFKHDIQGHLQMIEHLIDNNEIEELKNYSHSINHQLASNIFGSCTNIYIAGILNLFIDTITNENIEVTFHYDITKRIKVKNTHLSSLFYNLMTNAVESLLKNKIQESRQLLLRIGNVNEVLYIELENSVEKNFSLKNLIQGKTTKSDKENHGIGLISINQIIAEYNGSIEYEINDAKLLTRILLLDAFIAE
jgi:Signal transduction histidine kinase regulating citrate/malate metabolism